ncbi:MAG: glucosaminidase domain-containing protein [Prevotellaceae bacterium]|jgi:flagellar protein FlgJ|nr:glucosaminidase domain-containing protein [Prevotellaceae bacterium]
MNPQDFIRKYSLAIILSTEYTPLFPSVAIAQAALETGWGESTIDEANNMFGIKATGDVNEYWKGDKVLATTTEAGQGIVQQWFRAYNSLSDSIKDHANLLLTLSRYDVVLAAKTPEEQAVALQNAGYATSANYANSLISIINKYNLKEYDKKKNL